MRSNNCNFYINYLDGTLFFQLSELVSVEARIYERLKEVMQTADLDEVTSRDIRLKVDFKFIFIIIFGVAILCILFLFENVDAEQLSHDYRTNDDSGNRFVCVVKIVIFIFVI